MDPPVPKSPNQEAIRIPLPLVTPVQLTGWNKPVKYTPQAPSAAGSKRPAPAPPDGSRSACEPCATVSDASTTGKRKRATRDVEMCRTCWKQLSGAWMVQRIKLTDGGSFQFANGHADNDPTNTGRGSEKVLSGVYCPSAPEGDVEINEEEGKAYQTAFRSKVGVAARELAAQATRTLLAMEPGAQ